MPIAMENSDGAKDGIDLAASIISRGFPLELSDVLHGIILNARRLNLKIFL